MAPISMTPVSSKDIGKKSDEVLDPKSEIEKTQAELNMLQKLNARLKKCDKGENYFTFNDDAKDAEFDFMIGDGSN
jgi:hypothetical protein